MSLTEIEFAVELLSLSAFDFAFALLAVGIYRQDKYSETFILNITRIKWTSCDTWSIFFWNQGISFTSTHCDDFEHFLVAVVQKSEEAYDVHDTLCCRMWTYLWRHSDTLVTHGTSAHSAEYTLGGYAFGAV